MLNADADEIRILSILPSHPRKAGAIDCTVHHQPLRTNPIYLALSYVWGDPGVMKLILMNGHDIQVTTKLAEALY